MKFSSGWTGNSRRRRADEASARHLVVIFAAMIRSLPDPQSASRWCAQQRARHHTIGYVATMGALHRGHLSLVERAVRENQVTCASIFVNPLQFNNRDDLGKYPVDRERDIALLERVGCDMVYGGTLAGFFPEAADENDLRAGDAGDIGSGARGLEGVFRPGYLQGVCAIVERLFATVGPCNAYFGEKDFQQTLVIKNLARRLDGIKIIVCPTVRESSGLAMSSRNRRLDEEQQVIAAQLYQALRAAGELWRAGVRAAGELELAMRKQLNDERLRVEYAAIRDPENWSEDSPHGDLKQARALAAVYVGDVRLIDTLSLDDA